MVFGQPCTTVELLADAILLASAVPRRVCLPAARAPRDSDTEAVLAVRELPSRGRAAAGLGMAVTAGVRGAQRSFVEDAGAPRLFRITDDDVAAVADTLGGGVDERNDFWRNTPGEHDGSTSGEILLEGHREIENIRLKNLRAL